MSEVLRRRNTRYKSPQLVAQHCFVASFRRCFRFSPGAINLTRNKNIRCGLKKWLIGSGTSKFVARQVVSLMKNEQQNQNLLLKVDPGSTFRNNFLQPATNVFVVSQVDRAR